MSAQATSGAQAANTAEASAPPTDFGQLWSEALGHYKEKTGKDLSKLLSSEEFPADAGNVDGIIEYIKGRSGKFDDFRESGQKVLRALKPIVHFVHLFIDAGAEAASASQHAPGGKAIFTAVAVLLRATKGVSELYDDIETVFKKIQECLDRAAEYMKPSKAPSRALFDVLVKTLIQVLDILAISTKYCDITATKSGSGFKRALIILCLRSKDYFHGYIGEPDVTAALKELEKLTQAELLAAVAQTNANVRDIHPWVKFTYDRAVVDDLRSWLDCPAREPLNYERKREHDSCKWFFDSNFDEWRNHENGVYWVHGNAGAGKSVLSSSVVDTLKTDKTLYLIYFYFEFSDQKKQDCRALVSSLVSQLAIRSQECLDYLRGEHSSRPGLPTYEELLAMLSHLLCLSGRTFLVIDALDECPKSARDKGFSRFLDHLYGPDRAEKDIHMLITSRHEADIHETMSPLADRALNFHTSNGHRGELHVYTSTKLDGPAYPWSKDMELKAKVIDVLSKKSNGMFLCVYLYLSLLEYCTPARVLETLNELPTELHPIYERILNPSPPKASGSIEGARHVYECVALAKRPLSLAEAVHIFSTDIESSNLTVDPKTAAASAHASLDDVSAESTLRAMCPLLEIVEPTRPGDPKTVQFIHFSALEYLMSADLQGAGSPACRYYFDDPTANTTLAKICLLALISEDSTSGFWSYAIEYWPQHVSSSNEVALEALLSRFLYMGSSSFARWISTQSRKWGYNALHESAAQGLYHCVERILNSLPSDRSPPTDILSRTRTLNGGTALHVASARGRADVCQLLLDHGALTNDTDMSGWIPLHDAAYRGHLDVIRVLFEHPTGDGFDAAAQCRAHDSDERDGLGGTPLHYAVQEGHTEVCCVLIAHGAVVDDTNNDGRTPLHCAAELDLPEICRVLIAQGAFVDAADNDGATPLHHAALNGCDEVCRILIAHGAVVDAAENNGATPLHYAVVQRRKRRTEVCRVLIAHGAIVDDTCYNGKTLLCLAKLHGHEDVVALLLEHGATTNVPSIASSE